MVQNDPMREVGVLDATLMIADADARFADSVTELLATRQVALFRAGCAADVLHQLAVNSEIEVILLDAGLENGMGLEVAVRIRQAQPLVEIIMTCTADTVQTAIDGIRLGAADYVIKPCDPESLWTKISEAVGRKRRQEEKIVEATVREIVTRHD